MIEILEGLMPFRMLWDFLPLLLFVLGGFGIITIIETVALKGLKRLESPKNLFYSVSANSVGFLISLVLGVVLLYAFALGFGSGMAGYVGTFIISLIAIIVLIALFPILIFLSRLFIFRFFSVADTKFRLLYALVSTAVSVLLAPVGYLFFIAFLASLSR